MDQALNSQKTPHTSPWWASYGMSFVSILMKNNRVIKGFYCILKLSTLIKNIIESTHKFPYNILLTFLMDGAGVLLIRSRTTLKFWSATMFGAVARNFGPVHKFELPTVIADSVPRATRVFSLASVGHVTGHMVSHMVPIARCRPPYWKIFTVNNLATVF